MARNTKRGPRTLLDWDRGDFLALWKDAAHRKHRGKRLKELATLGLAAEAHGLAYEEGEDGDLRLLGLPEASVGTAPSQPSEPVKTQVESAEAIERPAPAEMPNAFVLSFAEQFA